MADFKLDQEPADNTEELIDEIISDDVVTVEISEPENQSEEEIKALAPLKSGAIGSTTKKVAKKTKPKKAPAAKKIETIAIHSTRNVNWQNVGKVEKGYNIKTKDEAEQWLTRNHIRLATPEEVAREFGV